MLFARFCAAPLGGQAAHEGDDEEGAGKKRKRKQQDPDAPKRPPSAYLMFLSEFRKTDEFKALEVS